MNRKKLETAALQAIEVLKKNLEVYTEKFPGSNTENQIYPVSENIEWTTGFCTGTYWLAYELTKDEVFRKSAMVQVESFYNRIENKIDVDHHDMGFLYTPSCVAAYMLTGSESGAPCGRPVKEPFSGKGTIYSGMGNVGSRG